MEEEKKVEEIKIEEVNNNTQVNETKIEDSKLKLIMIISVVSVLLLILLVIMFVSFFNKPKEVITDNQVGGEVNISYTDKTNSLNVVNLTPVEDETAIKDLTGDNYFEFSVETKIDKAKEVNYEISISKNTDKCTVNDKDIKIYLEKENSGSYTKIFGPNKFKGISKTSELGTPKGSMVLTKVTNKKSIIENYRLKVWLASGAETGTIPQNYSIDINVVGKAE